MPDERTPEEAEERFRMAMEEAERALEGATAEQVERFNEKLEQLEGVAARLRAPDTPDLEAEFSERLKALEERAEQAKVAREGVETQRRTRERQEGEHYRGLGVGLTVAYVIIGVPLGGAAAGWLLDQAFGTAYWIQVCTLAGAVAGVALALAIMNRTGARP